MKYTGKAQNKVTGQERTGSTTGGDKMKKLIVNDAAEGSKVLKRSAWILYDPDYRGSGILSITNVTLKPTRGFEEVQLEYPEYVCGRQGEAQYVHLPSYPDRLCFRALTGRLEESA